MNELNEVAELLSKKTQEGKLDWRLEGESRISTRQGSNIVEVTQNRSSAYALSIRNMDGILLAKEEFKQFESGAYGALDVVFLAARRASLGVDKAISDVKQRLLQL